MWVGWGCGGWLVDCGGCVRFGVCVGSVGV